MGTINFIFSQYFSMKLPSVFLHTDKIDPKVFISHIKTTIRSSLPITSLTSGSGFFAKNAKNGLQQTSQCQLLDAEGIKFQMLFTLCMCLLFASRRLSQGHNLFSIGSLKA